MSANILITGGAVRVGRELALRFSEAGFQVCVHYNSSGNEAEELAAHIKSRGGSCCLFQADLLKNDAAQKLIDRVCSEAGIPELLINNAAVFHRSSIQETDIPLLEQTFRVNLFAPFALTAAYARKSATGSVVNILDTKISGNGSLYAAYNLSKKALADFTRAAALELAPGIRVNGVAPGVLINSGGEGVPLPDPEKLPLKKDGTPEELFRTVLYLHRNRSVTGQIIYTDGGAHL